MGGKENQLVDRWHALSNPEGVAHARRRISSAVRSALSSDSQRRRRRRLAGQSGSENTLPGVDGGGLGEGVSKEVEPLRFNHTFRGGLDEKIALDRDRLLHHLWLRLCRAQKRRNRRRHYRISARQRPA